MDITNRYNFKLLIYCVKSRDLLSYRIQHTVIFQLSILIYVSKEKPCKVEGPVLVLITV